MEDDSNSLNGTQNGVKNEIDDSTHTKKSKKLKKKKDRKRKHSSSSCGSEDEQSMKKSKSKHKKKCKKRHKHVKEKKHKLKDKPEEKGVEEEKSTVGPEVPNDILQKAQSMAPMSKEEWEKRQSTIRRVYDEETGRTRLVRGEGEIIEEIVSRERHIEINRRATQGDGDFFQSKLKKLK